MHFDTCSRAKGRIRPPRLGSLRIEDRSQHLSRVAFASNVIWHTREVMKRTGKQANRARSHFKTTARGLITGQRWVRGSWHDSWGCGRAPRGHLRRLLSPHLCRRWISPMAPLCFGAWSWTAVFRSAGARVTVFAGINLHQPPSPLC